MKQFCVTVGVSIAWRVCAETKETRIKQAVLICPRSLAEGAALPAALLTMLPCTWRPSHPHLYLSIRLDKKK